jgi:hypothetical protein
LVTTARNRAINRIGRDRTLAAKTRLLEATEGVSDPMDATSVLDESIYLIFNEGYGGRRNWRRRRSGSAGRSPS